MPEFITFGETMALLTPTSVGSLEEASQFTRSMGGAESNVAIGIARLGLSVGWFGRLGRDPFGAYILKKVRGEGIDTSRVSFDAAYPTGLMVKEVKPNGSPNVYFYRRGSAFSQMTPADLDEAYIAEASLLHVTGIPPALSATCRDTLLAAVAMAKKHGTKVSFDPNIRLKLWNMDEARAILLEIAAQADYFLPGEEELTLMFETADRDLWLQRLADLQVPCTAVKLGEAGCLVVADGKSFQVPGVPVPRVVDTVGAGDGFAAGFLSSLLKGKSLLEAATIANAVGARCVTFPGDIEGLPTLDELAAFMGTGKAAVDR